MKKIVILGFLFLFILTGCSIVKKEGDVLGTAILSVDEAKAKAEDFINNNLMGDGQKATVTEVIEENGLYKVMVNTGGAQDIQSFMSKDGKTFFPQALDVEEINNQTNNNQEAPVAIAVPAIDENDHVKGNKDAKVSVIEYSDFECPFCLRHNKDMDKIFTEYKDSIKVTFRHFPLSFHPEAQKAAEAAECAGEQNKFWEMHDLIFAANENQTMSVAEWKKQAKTLGLVVAQFDKCLDDGKYADKIKADLSEGQSIGISGTPATFINGKVFSGAVGYEALKSEIEKDLAS